MDLEKIFKLSERQTTIQRECLAGFSTFLTMSYILLLNGRVLGKIGIAVTQVVIATALSSATGCFICGFLGNLPFGLAPGVGLSVYLTYGMVLSEGLSLTQAYTSCAVAGSLLWVFSVTGMSNIVIKLIPKSVKLATIVGMGLQIAVVGMTSVNMVVADDQTIIGLGSFDNYKMWYTFFGLILLGSLLFHQIPGGILIGIMVVTIITWMTDKSLPSTFMDIPRFEYEITKFISFSDFELSKCIPAVLSFLLVGIIDLGGVIFGMSSLAKLTSKEGIVPGSSYAFLGASAGTIVGACTGSTPLIVYVESAAGIKEGGRTGLTAVVVGLLFLVSLIFAPLFGAVPATATAPVSILVGAMMISQATEIDWDNMTEAIPAFLTLIIMPITFSITNGIIFGLLAAFLFYVTSGQMFSDVLIMFRSGPSTMPLLVDLAKQSPLVTKPDSDSISLTPGRGEVGGGSTLGERESFLPIHKTPSFITGTTPVRTPSLILPKEDAVAVRMSRGNSISGDFEGSDGTRTPRASISYSKYSSVSTNP